MSSKKFLDIELLLSVPFIISKLKALRYVVSQKGPSDWFYSGQKRWKNKVWPVIYKPTRITEDWPKQVTDNHDDWDDTELLTILLCWVI